MKLGFWPVFYPVEENCWRYPLRPGAILPGFHCALFWLAGPPGDLNRPFATLSLAGFLAMCPRRIWRTFEFPFEGRESEFLTL